MNASKISTPLNKALQTAQPGDSIELAVELAAEAPNLPPDLGRAARIAAKKEAFERAVEPIAAEIERLGGKVSEKSWLIRGIRARVSPQAVDALSDQSGVSKLDRFRQIEADSA